MNAWYDMDMDLRWTHAGLVQSLAARLGVVDDWGGEGEEEGEGEGEKEGEGEGEVGGRGEGRSIGGDREAIFRGGRGHGELGSHVVGEAIIEHAWPKTSL